METPAANAQFAAPHYQSILVGVDFSPGAVAAVRAALHIASAYKVPVRALHVVDMAILVELGESLTELQRAERNHIAMSALFAHLPRERWPECPDLRTCLLADAQLAWDNFVKDVPEAGALPFDVCIDNRIRGLIRAGQQHSTDLLVLGAYGDKKPEVGFGTIASSAVRSYPADVLLVRDTQSTPFQRIVAAVDFSETSARALRHAARIASAGVTQLHVLHVMQAPWRQLPRVTQLGPVELSASYAKAAALQLEEFARANLEPFGIIPARCDIFDEARHRSGIVAYAQQVGADLIALGTRGRSNLREVLLGSTAERTLKYSTSSILAVKPR